MKIDGFLNTNVRCLEVWFKLGAMTQNAVFRLFSKNHKNLKKKSKNVKRL